jgi:hypothetical protein
LRATQRALDQREKLLLLESHVRGEQEPESVEVAPLVRATVRDHANQMPDRDVVAQCTGDEWVMRISSRREGGKENLLLETEVRAAVWLPEREQRFARLVGGGGVCSPKLLRDDQRSMVVA